MAEISVIKSLLMFDQRVLNLGGLLENKEYTMNDIKNTMRFNEIYMSNMNELFRTQNKYKECIRPYIKDIAIVDDQMNGIINKIQEIDNTIKIDNDYNSFECRWAIMKLINNNLTTDIIDTNEIYEYNFKPGIIYYVISVNDMCIVSYLDPKLVIYQNPISSVFGGYKKYWKTDLAILEYLKNNYGDECNGVSLMVTRFRKSRRIVKFEVNGNDKDIKYISKIFDVYNKSQNIFMVRNKFLYTDDISQIASESKLYKRDDTPVDVYSYKNYKIDSSLEDIFKEDMLIEYPNDSFDNYLKLLHLASIDSNVESISVTLYRIGDKPIIYYILREAVKRGVMVHVNLELRASEEDINKFWANEMRSVGIDVSHYADGFLKVHCKLTLIKFKDGRMISQIGTGNYHSETTSQYTDLSLMTTSRNICSRIDGLLDIIIYGADENKLVVDSDLLITRYNARDELNKLITDQGNMGKGGSIFIKCNSFDDKEISKHLTIAASKGCIINLIIRGICTWIPPGDTLNKNVTIKSIVWDKLEHSRVYSFGNINPIVYMGSLDLMTNKLDDRIEVLVRITSGDTVEVICRYIIRYNDMTGWYMSYDKNGRIVYKK